MAQNQHGPQPDDNGVGRIPASAMRKMLLALAITLGLPAVALFVGGALFPHYADIAAPYPKPWLEVKPGMTSSEARKLLGEPWADGRNLKILDRWFVIQNCVEMRLDLWFGGTQNEGQNTEDSVVVAVKLWRKPSLPWRHEP